MAIRIVKFAQNFEIYLKNQLKTAHFSVIIWVYLKILSISVYFDKKPFLYACVINELLFFNNKIQNCLLIEDSKSSSPSCFQEIIATSTNIETWTASIAILLVNSLLLVMQRAIPLMSNHNELFPNTKLSLIAAANHNRAPSITCKNFVINNCHLT